MTVVTSPARARRIVARVAYAGLFMAALPALLALWAIRLDTWVSLPTFDAPVSGAVIALAGSALMLAGMWTLWVRGGGLPASPFPPARLVTGGIYGVLAHPIYVGAVLASFGVSLLGRSAAGLWIVSPVFALAAAAFVIGFERDATRHRYGSVATPLLQLPPDGNEPPAFRHRAAVMVLVWLPWGILYQAVEALGVPPDAMLAYFVWETRLPIVPWTEVIYAGTYVFVLAAALVATRTGDLRAFAHSGLWATALILPLYLLVPLIAPARPVSGDGLWQTLMRWERAFDEPVTAFPAFHVVWGCLAAHLWSRTFPRWRLFFQACVAAIAVSCVTTGMHAVVDVVGGFAAYGVVARRRVLWRKVCDGAEWIANGWREVSLGPARFLALCNPALPGCNAPPTFTSPAGNITAHAGVGMTLNLEASDQNAGDTVTIAPNSMPAGATFAMTDPTPSNPAHATMTWTPPAPGINAACFYAQDSNSVLSYGTHCFSIDVVNETPTLSCSANLPVSTSNPLGTSVLLSVTPKAARC